MTQKCQVTSGSPDFVIYCVSLAQNVMARHCSVCLIGEDSVPLLCVSFLLTEFQDSSGHDYQGTSKLVNPCSLTAINLQCAVLKRYQISPVCKSKCQEAVLQFSGPSDIVSFSCRVSSFYCVFAWWNIQLLHVKPRLHSFGLGIVYYCRGNQVLGKSLSCYRLESRLVFICGGTLSKRGKAHGDSWNVAGCRESSWYAFHCGGEI